MPHERTELDTPRLTLLAYTPEQLLALIEEPQAFEEIAALTPADGLRGFYVSGDVSPQWLEALRAAVGQGPNPWRHGFFIIEKASGEIVGGAGFKGAPDGAGMVEFARHLSRPLAARVRHRARRLRRQFRERHRRPPGAVAPHRAHLFVAHLSQAPGAEPRGAAGARLRRIPLSPEALDHRTKKVETSRTAGTARCSLIR